MTNVEYPSVLDRVGALVSIHTDWNDIGIGSQTQYLLGIRIWSFFRHSDFVIRHSLLLFGDGKSTQPSQETYFAKDGQ